MASKAVAFDIESGGGLAPDLPSDQLPMTDFKSGLTDEQVQKAFERFGPNEIPVPSLPLYKLFLRQFTGFLPVLIEVAALISLSVQEYIDFGIIAGILLVNAVLGFREEYHAKKALDEISNSIESEVTVRRNGGSKLVPAAALVPGDIILLVGGTVVPADIKWLSGDKMKIDTASLTGEPLPRTYPSQDYGDLILSGTTVVSGECYGQVMATATDTEIGQAQADILKDKSVRVISVFQKKIMHVVQILVSSCMVIVLAVFLVEGLVYKGFDKSVRKTVLEALSILIASIPVALPLVLQVNLALGAAFMAKKYSAIVTSIPALQDIASMSMLCSDKTGTLTTAKMSIIEEEIYAAEGFTKEDVLMYAYLSSNTDKMDDPIDKAIGAAFKTSETAAKRAEEYRQTEIIGFNPIVKRVVAFVDHQGKTITIAKGLPAKILDTSAGGADDHEFQWVVDNMRTKGFERTITNRDQDLGTAGYKTIAVAICEGNARELDEPVWKYVGLLPMLDPPRHDTEATIASLHHANISVKMITGDHVNVAKETSRLIGLGTNIHAGEDVRHAPMSEKKSIVWNADGFASVLPSDKRDVVLTLRDEFRVVTGMTGDGVNDAPALSAAQVGIAVHGATDAAKNAADLILTEPGLSPIYGAVLESRRIFARIKAYVIYRVAASLMLALTLSTIVFASGCAVNSLLVIILALLNDVSMIPVAYDRAQATSKPQMPNATKLVLQSLYYGLAHTTLALVYIFSMDHASNGDVVLTGKDSCTTETQGFIWFYLVLVTELAIFSVRAPSFFWKSTPSALLLLSVLLTCLTGALIAVFSTNLSVDAMGYIIIFNVVAFVVVDFGKVPFRHLIGENPGEPITSDELVEVTKTEKQPSESAKFLAKQLRYQVHLESVLDPADLDGSISVISNNSFMDGFWAGNLSTIDGYVHRGYGGRHAAFASTDIVGAGEARSRRQRMASSPAAFHFAPTKE